MERGRVKGMEGEGGGGRERMVGTECRQLYLCDVYTAKTCTHILVADGTANGNEGAVGLMLWVVFPRTGVQPVAPL